MKRIAVACDNGLVSGHFGHCETFLIVDSENGQIVKSEIIPNPRHQFGFLPEYLADQGINVVISGKMGAKPYEVLNRRNVEVILGVQGNAKEAAEAYLNGILKADGTDYGAFVHNCGCGCRSEHHHE